MICLKKFRIIPMFLILILLIPFSSNAQTGKIIGKVVDAFTNEALPVANVMIDGTSRGAATDLNGNYVIMAVQPGTYSLVFSYAGYASTVVRKVPVLADSVVIVDARLMEAYFDVGEPYVEVQFTKPEVKLDEVSKISRSGIKFDADVNYSYYSPSVACFPEENFNTEEYDFENENSFYNALTAPFSTFSVDVDKASYSNMRRFLDSRQWPQAGVVRIEELINYFDYDYPKPAKDEAVSLVTQLTDSPWNNNKLLRIGIKSIPVYPEEMPLANFVFLMDVSGSMSHPKKLGLAKEAMTMLVNQMRPNDRISIVTYASRTAVHLESTPCSQREKILSAINILGAGGSTAGGAGIRLAYEQAVNNFIKNGNNRVILCTDGDFNIGISSTADLTKLVEEKRDTGVFLSVLGFGYGNLKDNRLESLADNGNGNYAYIDDSREARQYFVYEMAGNLLTVAKDVKVQVEFNPYNVESYRLIGYENRLLEIKDFEDDTKDAGDLGANQDVTAIYEIVLNKNNKIEQKTRSKYLKASLTDDAVSGEYATVNVRYKEANSDNSKLISHVVNKKNYKEFWKSDDSMKFSTAVAMFGMILTDSKFSGTASFDGILEIARSARGEDKMAKRADFIRLVEIAKEIHKDINPDIEKPEE